MIFCWVQGVTIFFWRFLSFSFGTGRKNADVFDFSLCKSEIIYIYTSSARTSRGRKFQRKKTISQRKNLPIECAQGDRPARCPNHFFAVNEPSAVPRWWCFVLWSEVFWCLDPVLQSTTQVLQSTTPVITCTTKYYSVLQSTTKYYPVLQSTTPVLPCTTKYYSSTTLCWSATPILRTTDTTLYTPVLPCTTKYYSSNSSTTLYYKVLLKYYSVLLQYYPVLQSTTPVLLCAEVLLQYSVPQILLCILQYYPVLQSTTQVTPVLPCTTKYYSSTNLYYKVLLQY